MALARASVLALDDRDPAAAWRRAERYWRPHPDIVPVAIVSGVAAGEGAVVAIHEAVGGEIRRADPRRVVVSRHIVIGISANSGETVVLEIFASDGAGALGRAQAEGHGFPGIILVAAIQGDQVAAELTLETLPGRFARRLTTSSDSPRR